MATNSSNKFAFDLGIAKEAAKRYRPKQHEKLETAVRKKQYSLLDTKQRMANRVNRLIKEMHHAAPKLVRSVADSFESITPEIKTAKVTAETVSDALLERVIGASRDFLFVEFLEQALYASRSVGRIVTKIGDGRVSYATGFMVSPSLLMTNWHVLGKVEDAGNSVVEFDYQRDRTGQPLAVRRFKLDPARFFLNDKSLDFALVAVNADGPGRPLSDYGWCPILKELGKIVGGEPINIVQHPRGEMKQIVMRENRLIDSFDGKEDFLQYEADTEPGSSGSPVFNDQWEVIALHHSAVPRKNAKGDFLAKDGKVWKEGSDPAQLDWVANEGVRASKLVEFIAAAKIDAVFKSLRKEFLDAKSSGMTPGPELKRVKAVPTETTAAVRQQRPEQRHEVNVPAGQAGMSLTIPLRVTVGISVEDFGHTPQPEIDAAETPADEIELEKIEPDPNDPDYRSRPGYREKFLGFTAPFPQLTEESRPHAYQVSKAKGNRKYLLDYYHYSLIFNQDRKLAYVSGVNYDPLAKVQYKRDKGGDKWYYDPRVRPEKKLQAGEGLYTDNPLDRGHLVRRADAGWGATVKEAKLANDDTFHFTNCSPQHAITNQGKLKEAPPGLKLWGKLEDHVARQGKANARKLNIFNGPIFRDDDDEYRGILLPREFWKLVVYENDDGEPAAVAFILTQAELIEDLKEEFDVDEYKAVQRRVKYLESKTNLDFGPFSHWDAMAQEGAEESFTGGVPAVVLNSVSDIVL